MRNTRANEARSLVAFIRRYGFAFDADRQADDEEGKAA